MNMISQPFTSEMANGEPDRAITSEQQRKINKMMYRNGVFLGDGMGLHVTAQSGMTVQISPGGCFINGAIGILENPISITLDVSDFYYDRYDRIVARFDTSTSYRCIDVYKKTGTATYSPVPRVPVKQSNYYELVLATIKVSANTVTINSSDIKDERLNSNLCGLVVPAIPQPLNLDDIYNQYQSAIDGTLAGELQNQIGLHETQIVNIQDTLNNVNPYVSDSGFINLKLNTSKFKFGGTADKNYHAFYRKIGKQVIISFAVLTATNINTSSAQIIASLPPEIVPDEEFDNAVFNSSGRYFVNVSPRGNLTLNGTNRIDSGQIVRGSISYFI